MGRSIHIARWEALLAALKGLAKWLLRRIPAVDRLYSYRLNQWVPPGHFYSPIPSQDEIVRRENAIFGASDEILGVDLNEAGQLQHLRTLLPYALDQPFGVQSRGGNRFAYGNGTYDYGDALFTYATIAWARPKRIVEVGCGHSSALILDTIESLTEPVTCTFIDPYPDVLERLMRPSDRDVCEVVAAPVQEVDLEAFARLQPGDILFIDSTHVAKFGSDVNHLFFKVLPQIAPGVLVHIHDVFHPFEYRRDWIFEGRAWNELYVLRAFLQYNRLFEILHFFDYLRRFHWEELSKALPVSWDVEGWALGSSLWLRKGEG